MAETTLTIEYEHAASHKRKPPQMRRNNRLSMAMLTMAATAVGENSTFARQSPRPSDIYFPGGFQLRNAPFGSESSTPIATTAGLTYGVDILNDQLYFTCQVEASRVGQIWRVNPDGTGQTLLVTRPAFSSPRQIQAYEGQVYWNERENFYRANPDGTGVELVMQTDEEAHLSTQFAIGNGRLYWMQLSSTQLYSRLLDGSDYQRIDVGVFGDEMEEIHPFSDGLIIGIGNNTALGQPPSRVVTIDYDTGEATTLWSQMLELGLEFGSVNTFGDRVYFSINDRGGCTMYSMPLTGGDPQTEFTTTRYAPYQMLLVPAPASGLIAGAWGLGLRRRRRAMA